MLNDDTETDVRAKKAMNVVEHGLCSVGTEGVVKGNTTADFHYDGEPTHGYYRDRIQVGKRGVCCRKENIPA